MKTRGTALNPHNRFRTIVTDREADDWYCDPDDELNPDSLATEVTDEQVRTIISRNSCDRANQFDTLGTEIGTLGQRISAIAAYGAALESKDLADYRRARLFNNRAGLSRKDDTLPTRLLDEPLPDGPAKGQLFGREGLSRMLDEYYDLRGWDRAGVPRSETLTSLGITG